MWWLVIVLNIIVLFAMIYVKEFKLRDKWMNLTVTAKIVWWALYCLCLYLALLGVYKILFA
jgi:hypothetical protein